MHPDSPPSFRSLSSNLESPQLSGSEIEWTAKASDPQDDILLYNFILKNADSGSILEQTGWNSNNKWVWITDESDSGEYIVEAWVKDGHHSTKVDEPDDQCSKNYKIIPNKIPYFISLTPDKKSPQKAGSNIVWTAEANDPENDNLEYKFILKNSNTGSIINTGGWKDDNEWKWVTTESDGGEYLVEAWVRDGNHATQNDDSDDQYSIAYKISENERPYFVSLSPDMESPQPAGSKIVWTAKAKDTEDDNLEYRFILKNADTGSTLTTGGWKNRNTWNWRTIESDSGDYVVEAWVRDGHHSTENDDSDDRYSSKYTLIDGRRIKIENECTSEINLILRYKSPISGWITDGPWPIKSEDSTYLGSDESDYIRSISEYFYFYAYSSDRNYIWSGNDTWKFKGEDIYMDYWKEDPDHNNDYVLTLDCS